MASPTTLSVMVYLYVTTTIIIHGRVSGSRKCHDVTNMSLLILILVTVNALLEQGARTHTHTHTHTHSDCTRRQ